MLVPDLSELRAFSQTVFNVRLTTRFLSSQPRLKVTRYGKSLPSKGAARRHRETKRGAVPCPPRQPPLRDFCPGRPCLGNMAGPGGAVSAPVTSPQLPGWIEGAPGRMADRGTRVWMT